MTITYSLWDGAQLLGAGLTANSADEMNKVVADLQKVSVNVVAHMRKVSQWTECMHTHARHVETQVSLFSLTMRPA